MSSPVFIESPIRTANRERYAEAASLAANTKNYQRAIDSALAGIQGVKFSELASKYDASALARPQLASPNLSADSPENTGDTYTRLMATLVMQLGDANLAEVTSNALILNNKAKAVAANNEALSQEYSAAVKELDAAVNSATIATDNLEKAKVDVESAKTNLEKEQQALQQAEPGTPEHEAAQVAVKQAEATLAEANKQLKGAESDATAAVKVAENAGKKTDELNKAVLNAGPAAQAPTQEARKAEMNASATMILLMTQLAELMGESEEESLTAQQEMFSKIQIARQGQMEVDAAEYAAEVEAAEAANKAMGCIGKLVGALITVASVALAAVSGGASLVIAGIGLAIMAADMVVKEATGTSFIQEALKPLMEGIAGLAKAIAAGLGGLIGEEAAQILGVIFAVLLVVAVAIAATALTKSAASSKLMGQVTKKLGGVVSDLSPDMLKQAGRAISRNAASMTSKLQSALRLDSPAAVQGLVSKGSMVVEGGAVAGVTAQSYFGVQAGIAKQNAAEHLADVTTASYLSDAAQKAIDELIQLFIESLDVKQSILETASSIQQRVNNTAISMARHI